MPKKLGYLPLLRFSVQVFSLLDYSCVPEKHQHISRGLSPDPVMEVTGKFLLRQVTPYGQPCQAPVRALMEVVIQFLGTPCIN